VQGFASALLATKEIDKMDKYGCMTELYADPGNVEDTTYGKRWNLLGSLAISSQPRDYCRLGIPVLVSR
jgi:hypothetical protein